MKILLKFDFDSRILYIPDGYIKNVDQLQQEFFEWIYYQKDNISLSGGGLAYGPDDFLRYINTEVLACGTEVAYFLPALKRGRIHAKLSF